MVWYISGKIAVYDAFTGAEKRHMFFGAFVLCILVNLSIYIYLLKVPLFTLDILLVLPMHCFRICFLGGFLG